MATHISKTEKIIILFAFFLMAIPVCSLQCMLGIMRQGDTAFLYQAVESMATRGLPYTQVNSSINAAVPLWSMPAEEVCDSPLDPPKRREISQFERHAYFILYAIAPLNWIIPANILVPAVTALGFLFMLLVTYFMLRERGVSIIGALLFCLLVSAHPAWSLGIFGQPYSDRFFVPLGALFVFLLTRGKTNLWHVFFSGVLASLVIERTGFILGAFTLIYALLDSSQSKRNKVILSIMAFAFVGYSILIAKYFLPNPDNASFLVTMLDPSSLRSRFQSPEVLQGVMTFLLFNVLFLGIFSMSDPKLWLIALAVMIPNVLGNIGGAELMGWATHYHSQYFPILVCVSAIGFAKLSNMLGSKRKMGFLHLFTIFLIILCASAYAYTADGNTKRFSFTYLRENAWLKTGGMLAEYYHKGKNSSLGYQMDHYRRVRDAIPENSVITSPEGYFAALYDKGDIHYYPLAIDVADYAILVPVHRSDNRVIFTGAVTYLGDENQVKLEECLNERLKKAGYDLENPVMIGSTAVLKRYGSMSGTPAAEESLETLPPRELLENPGFENSSDGQPVGWLAYGAPIFDRSGSRSHSGQAAIQLTDYNSGYYQVLSTEAGNRYIMSHYARADQEGQHARLQINWTDGQGNILGSSITVVQVTSEWQRYEMSAVAPEGATRKVIYATVDDGDSQVWFDDFSLKRN